MAEETKKQEKVTPETRQTAMLAAAFVLVFVLGGGLGYVGATALKGQNGIARRNQTTANSFGDEGNSFGRGMMGGRGGIGFGGRQSGEVTAVDGNKITIKLPNGNTETLTVSDTTVYKTVTTGTKDSIKVGSTIAVTGTDTSNSGSVTQITVQ